MRDRPATERMASIGTGRWCEDVVSQSLFIQSSLAMRNSLPSGSRSVGSTKSRSDCGSSIRPSKGEGPLGVSIDPSQISLPSTNPSEVNSPVCPNELKYVDVNLPGRVDLQERLGLVPAILKVQHLFLNGQVKFVTQYPNPRLRMERSPCRHHAAGICPRLFDAFLPDAALRALY